MYNWEIENLLRQRDYYIGGDELLKVISVRENPQLMYIKRYDGTWRGEEGKCIYYMEARGDFNPQEVQKFSFCAMPYEEAKEKGFVKCKK